MPKIDAPTVVEHHARRRAAIVSAAVDLLGADGAGAVTPAAVAAVAGLARSSVYLYYPSTGALVGAAVEEVFRRALADLTEAMAGARTPEARVTAYVDAGIDAAMASSMAKCFASDAAVAQASNAVQIFGGSGFIRGYEVERLYRDAKITQIYEGTNQIQRVIIARKLLE